MKNPVKISNKKDDIYLFVYEYDKNENEYIQLAFLKPNETTLLNIKPNTTIIFKNGKLINNLVYPDEIILQTVVNQNFFIF